MTDSSSFEEKQDQRDRPRLEFPILQAFRRAVAECRTYPVTTMVVAVCVVNFLLVNLVTNHAGSVVQDILVPGPVAIWTGAVWGLVTPAFVHFAWWHILFNMWWARDFGHLLEPDLGRRRYIGFILIGAIASSGWQLLTTDGTGIGFSGVVYALFGYILARRRSRPAFRDFLRSSTIFWLLGWLVFCVVLTIARVWNVGNAAHIAGLAFGYLLGLARERPRLRVGAVVGLSILFIGVVASCSYMPWSAVWRARHFIRQVDTWRRQAEAGDVRAQAMYGSTLARWPQDRERGMEWLRRAAKAGDAWGTNGLAWWLATAPEDALRNGREAVQWAEKQYKAYPTANSGDTLAAAFAEADRWEEAIATQERALRDLPTDSTKYADEFRQRLELYKQHKKWREHP